MATAFTGPAGIESLSGTQPSFNISKSGGGFSGEVTRTSRNPTAGGKFSFTAKVTATGKYSNDIFYSVLGSKAGDIYSVKQIYINPPLTISTTLPESSAGKTLVWTAIPTLSPGAARSGFPNRVASGDYATIGTIGTPSSSTSPSSGSSTSPSSGSSTSPSSGSSTSPSSGSSTSPSSGSSTSPSSGSSTSPSSGSSTSPSSGGTGSRSLFGLNPVVLLAVGGSALTVLLAAAGVL